MSQDTKSKPALFAGDLAIVTEPAARLSAEEQDAAQESKQSITEDARQDEFLQSIAAEDGPLALYKQNRLAGRYRRVSSTSFTTA